MCKECGKPLTEEQKRRLRKYCTDSCRSIYSRKIYAQNNFPSVPSLSTSTRGAISELMVCTDLMSKGWSIFRALSPTCCCDLVGIDPEGISRRIEVKTGTFNLNGSLSYPPPINLNNFDILAIVTIKGIFYLYKQEDSGQSALSLSVPSPNSQLA